MEKYTWEEIKSFLIKELKKTKHIMTWGTFGSLSLEHDVDTIVTKKSNSSSAEFFKEIHKTLDSLNKYLNKKYNKKLIRFSHLYHEKDVLKIAGYEKEDLIFHLITYISWPHLEDNWKITKDFDVKKFIDENYEIIFGRKEDLFKKEFQKEGKYDRVFTTIACMDRINANYSEKFLIECMDFLYNYMTKQYSNEEKIISKNEKEVRENFYKICDILDKINN